MGEGGYGGFFWVGGAEGDQSSVTEYKGRTVQN